MRSSAERALAYCSGIDLNAFLNSTLIQDAVVRNIEILGEACKSISPSIKQKYPDFAWKNIAGMRDKLIHDYFGVNVDIVWEVVVNDLPTVLKFLDELPEDLRSDS
jgi:uncharacterized protein with HEPN domain